MGGGPAKIKKKNKNFWMNAILFHSGTEVPTKQTKTVSKQMLFDCIKEIGKNDLLLFFQ